MFSPFRSPALRARRPTHPPQASAAPVVAVERGAKPRAAAVKPASGAPPRREAPAYAAHFQSGGGVGFI